MRISDFATEVLNIVGRGGDHVDTYLQARLLPDTDDPAYNPGIINRAILRIARNWAWRELRIRDESSFATTEDQSYVDISAADPIRNIVSVVLSDTTESRKLIRVEDSRQFDSVIPYPAGNATGHPSYYAEEQVQITDGETTTNTHCLILNPIPDDAYDLLLRYSKWPSTYESDETPELTQIDDVILNCAVSMTYSVLAEYSHAVFWYTNQYIPSLEEAVRLEVTHPDWDMIWLGHTRPPDLQRSLTLSPWMDPFVQRC